MLTQNVIDIELPAELEALFQSRLPKLQMLPGVATQALEIARDPNCTIREFVAVVERDAKLAADMLSLSNSPVYSSGGPPAVSLQHAVIRLGFRQCRNLIFSSSMASMLRMQSLEEEWINEQLCRHGFLTGMLASEVNKLLDCGFQGEAFAAGLMHDFGRIFLAVCLPQRFLMADPLHFDESEETTVAEKLFLGTDHCDVGAWYAVQNHLPDEFVEVIRYHHSPMMAQKHRRLVALTTIADHMANYLQRFEDAAGYSPDACDGVSALESTGIHNVNARLSSRCEAMMDSSRRDARRIWSV